MKMRTKKEFDAVFDIMLTKYDTYVDLLHINKDEAKRKIINSYDDFVDLAYFKGSFSKEIIFKPMRKRKVRRK